MQRLLSRAAVVRPLAALCSARFASTKQFTESHEWIAYDAATKTATLGLSNYAVEQLQDVTYIELPNLGLELQAGDRVCAVESVKTTSDVFTPVAGVVAEVNEVLRSEKNLGQLKDGGAESDELGWILKLKNVELGDAKLMNAEEFKAFVDSHDH